MLINQILIILISLNSLKVLFNKLLFDKNNNNNIYCKK